MNQQPVGQTKAAGFQAGVRKTLNVGPDRLWRFIVSERGQALLGQKPAVLDAGSPGVTTFILGSHYRQRIPSRFGRQAIMQVRVIGSASGKATLALHAEKLADPEKRADTIKKFKMALSAIEKEMHDASRQ